MRFFAFFKYCQILAILLFICGLVMPCHGQKEANVWIFGDNLGIDFNFDRFRPFNGTKMNQFGGSASICDSSTGDLLFYTDGRTIWDRNFKRMPNGVSLRGGYSTDQAALIIPNPASRDQYYVFTTKSFGDTIPLPNVGDSEYSGLYYSLVDMRLNGGYGDVIKQEKNTLIIKNSTEKLTAIPHKNNKDYWLISHEWGSDRFVVFLVNDLGIGSPKYYSFGMVYAHMESKGRLTPSPNGKLLACAVSSPPNYESANPLELYDFDAATGVISNRRVLGRFPNLYGVSFSPNNTKLYFSFFDNYQPYGDRLFQMDLDAGNVEEIVKTKTQINFIYDTGIGTKDTISSGMLNLAPDGRLYSNIIASRTTKINGERIRENLIFYLNKPNLYAQLSEPSYRYLKANAKNPSGNSFPNFMQSYFNNLEPVDNSNFPEKCITIEPILYPNPVNKLLFIKNDPVNCLIPATIRIYNNLGQLLRVSL